MRAILLCAGFATRMSPLTDDFPKPLLPVGGRPLLDDLVSQLEETRRIDSVSLVSNGRFHAHFAEWVLEASERYPSLEFTLLDDGVQSNETRLGAVGDLALALRAIPPDGPALVTAGDNLFRFDMSAFFRDHDAKPRNLILCYREEDLARLRRSGVPELGPEGRVVRMWEKPENPPSRRACPPFYVLHESALRRVPSFLAATPDADAPGHFIAWLAEQEPVFAHDMKGERLDIGNLEQYRGAEAWLRGR